MGRKRSGVRHRDRGPVPHKADTPAVGRLKRHKRLLTNRPHEVIPEEEQQEEEEEEEWPTQRKSKFPWKPPPRARPKADTAAAPVPKTMSPLWLTSIQMTPDPEAFKSGGKKVKMEEPSFAVTLESVTSSSKDTTYDEDDEDEEEEECYSSTPSSSCSLPSPENFREECDVKSLIFHSEEELLGLDARIKNSTLLDGSCTHNIHIHGLPDISAIFDSSTTDVKINREIKNQQGPEAKSQTHMDSINLYKVQAFRLKTPIQITNRRPIICKKKVSFKTPVAVEVREEERVTVSKLSVPNPDDSAKTSDPAEQVVKPQAEVSREEEEGKEEEEEIDSPHPRMTLKRPVRDSPSKAKFFDFATDVERDVFSLKARERAAKLRAFTFTPLTLDYKI